MPRRRVGAILGEMLTSMTLAAPWTKGLAPAFVELVVALALLVGALVALQLLERATARYVAHRLGWRGVLLTGWVGVPLHETSHLLAAKLFGHRVIDWKLFSPDPVTGTLGYVRHAVRRDTAWQRLGYLASGLAPAIAGALVLGLLAWWALPTGAWGRLSADRELALSEVARGEAWLALLAQLGALARDLGAELWRGRSPWLPLQLYLAIAVVCHMAPSRADLSLAGHGLVAALLLLVAATVGCVATGVVPPGRSLLGLIPALVGLLMGAALLQGCYVLVLRLVERRRRGGAVVLGDGRL
ncbi:MAG: hypothetical protein CSA65_04950 [Proteobacteria bacterium]|nr:MAG: hypothetical protein CSB49_05885 [Pseudomonadota bacterium]PIE18464.1 MAG: hypothetical protein CSA65_04950 [Pseudomonadota bacterium]